MKLWEMLYAALVLAVFVALIATAAALLVSGCKWDWGPPVDPYTVQCYAPDGGQYRCADGDACSRFGCVFVGSKR